VHNKVVFGAMVPLFLNKVGFGVTLPFFHNNFIS
jgi:hypothetical protein